MAKQITGGDFVHLPRVFEQLSAVLVRGFFGAHADFLHLGSPRVENPQFSQAMKHANEKTREWIWGPDPDLPNGPSDTGDHGVDFVVWNPPPDGRVGSAFVLGQCACGDDWHEKFGDVDIARYSKWFNPLSYVTPQMRAFTTPHHIGDGFLNEALRRAGMVFDRSRLTLLADAMCTSVEYSNWQKRIHELTRLVIVPSGSA